MTATEADLPEEVSALPDEERSLLEPCSPPDWLDPMLAVLWEEPFSDPDWLYERKLDGERCLVFRTHGEAHLFSRNRQSLEDTYPELADALAEQRDGFVADGEIVAFEGKTTSFSRLQHRLGIDDPEEARRSGIAVYLYLFDLMWIDGFDLRRLPLRRRKSLLRGRIRWRDPVRFTPHRNERGEELLEEACERGWEGLIAKRADGPYTSSRSRDWRKLKCSKGQELVIVGYTAPQGERTGFGALALGYYDEGRLRYAGKVGTGFDRRTLESLSRRLARLERQSSPLAEEEERPSGIRWVRPDLVAEIAFTEWTRDHRLRHPRFVGLRDDKDPEEVVRERPAD